MLSTMDTFLTNRLKLEMLSSFFTRLSALSSGDLEPTAASHLVVGSTFVLIHVIPFCKKGTRSLSCCRVKHRLDCQSLKVVIVSSVFDDRRCLMTGHFVEFSREYILQIK